MFKLTQKYIDETGVPVSLPPPKSLRPGMTTKGYLIKILTFTKDLTELTQHVSYKNLTRILLTQSRLFGDELSILQKSHDSSCQSNIKTKLFREHANYF